VRSATNPVCWQNCDTTSIDDIVGGDSKGTRCTVVIICHIGDALHIGLPSSEGIYNNLLIVLCSLLAFGYSSFYNSGNSPQDSTHRHTTQYPRIVQTHSIRFSSIEISILLLQWRADSNGSHRGDRCNHRYRRNRIRMFRLRMVLVPVPVPTYMYVYMHMY
jgi:hypothetical protein